MLYDIRLRISKQEDGLFRVECPDLQGCFVDSPSLEEALADIQDAMLLWFSSQRKLGWPVPAGVRTFKALPYETRLPVEVQ